MYGDNVVFPRIIDLQAVLPGMTGKIELVFEGEQEGTVKVSKALIGKSVRQVFKKYFPDPLQRKSRNPEAAQQNDPYGEIIKWFESGNMLELTDEMKFKDYVNALKTVKGLETAVKKHLKNVEDEYELATMMEFVLDGLHQNSKIAKEEGDESVSYKDMLGSMLKESSKRSGRQSSYDIEEEWNY
jgi:magnesium chelatase subunit I